MVLVEHGQAVIEDGAALHFERRVLLDAGNLVRRDVAGELVFARKQPVDAARNLGHFEETDALERRPAAPIFVMRFEGQRYVGLELDDLVRARRDRLARPVEIARGLLPGTAVHDVGAVARQPALNRDVGRRVVEAHRVLVDGIDAHEVRPDAAGDRRHIRRQFLARARRRDLLEGLDGGAALGLGLAEHALAAEGEDDVFGRQLVAIVELHALAQLHLDGLVVDAAPLGGEARHGLQAATPVLGDQALPDRGEEHALADVRLLAQHVEHVRIRHLLHGNRHRRTVVRLPDREARQEKRARGNAAGLQDGATGEFAHDDKP
ncbi:putative transcriptional regulator [Bradyrhizobium sp. i1.4.4]